MEEISVGYKSWLIELKSKINSAQIKAAIAVNSALIPFYWDLGKMISEKEALWGSKLIEQLSRDLQLEFPEMKGLSRTNLFNSKKFYEFYTLELVQQPVGQLPQKTENNTNMEFVQQVVAQIPWGHNILIFTKINNIPEAKFYIEQTIENNWSREALALQIKSDLYKRKGKAISNFNNTLPAPMSDLAEQTLKDPYVFDFMAMTVPYKERDIENQLVKHITTFLLEFGKGFAFMGQV